MRLGFFLCMSFLEELIKRTVPKAHLAEKKLRLESYSNMDIPS